MSRLGALRAAPWTGRRRLAVPAPRTDMVSDNFVCACIGCLAVVSAFLVLSPECRHWFVMPVFACGLLIVPDALRWLRGQGDTFDPLGIVGLLGVHFFFLAPLLHVALDYWMHEVQGPPDWRPWLGGMAILNALGLAVYRWTAAWSGASAWRDASPRRQWRLAPGAVRILLPIFLLLTAAAQVAVYVNVGGIGGVVSAYEARAGAFEGMGWVFMISESLPILAMIGCAAYWQRRNIRPDWATLLAVLAAFVLLKLIFGGLRGSRSNTIYAVVWAVGIIHFWIRPVSRKMVLLAVPCGLLFMYVYGFYKSAGWEATRSALGSAETRVALEQDTKRTFQGILLGDLGRSDVQAVLLYRFWETDSDCSYAWGTTYATALMQIVPRNLWPDRPEGTAKAGTEALYGRGTYDYQMFRSARIFGLAGEAMLNFGPLSVPLAFGALGLLVGWLRRSAATWRPGDVRRLFVPPLVIVCLLVLSADLRNVVFSCMHYGPMVVLFVFLASECTSDKRKVAA